MAKRQAPVKLTNFLLQFWAYIDRLPDEDLGLWGRKENLTALFDNLNYIYLKNLLSLNELYQICDIIEASLSTAPDKSKIIDQLNEFQQKIDLKIITQQRYRNGLITLGIGMEAAAVLAPLTVFFFANPPLAILVVSLVCLVAGLALLVASVRPEWKMNYYAHFHTNLGFFSQDLLNEQKPTEACERDVDSPVDEVNSSPIPQ
ncbi:MULTISPECIES: hypothetical protein [Legionella]|uniref:Uncharacterized protein n=1 Tax=Legionella maceachernii TaxID=466 RepID=A0A0W0WHT7_9GAMM|nr:hypothetical protein [Legionella maceachernii]KTD31895.1 hypothetical protein Lmac_0085 [Legionella maceachernii]SJZ44752.1 hypothetical protein SAMN02745128_00036 [Legionella maceachernii]SUP04136.1 Uncharacterised protein [Legionella maceachernii]